MPALPPFTPSRTGALLFVLCFWGWALFELAVNLRTWRAGTINRDRASRYLIIGGMLVAFALALAATRLHRFDILPNRTLVFYGGLLLMLLGLLFRAYSIHQLGAFFVPEVAIQPEQTLIEHGPYRWIRHPSYTGIFITVTGYGLALTNGLSLFLMLAISGPLFAYRIWLEEAALVEAFGDDYRAYMRRTRRLIPFVL